MQAEGDHHHGQQQSGRIAHIARGLHQGNASHLPVVAQNNGGQQQPGVEGQQVRVGQNSGETGRDVEGEREARADVRQKEMEGGGGGEGEEKGNVIHRQA